MKIKANAAVFILLATTAPTWAQSPSQPKSDSNPGISEIATTFTNYTKITKDAVYVNPELAILCRGASKEDVEAARARSGPHANTAILIYMNPPAASAFATNAGAFPVGSVIVKQKKFLGYRENGKWVYDVNNGAGGMVKRSPGYDSDHGDWEYFYFADPKKIESGRIVSCVQCHEAAKEKDHVFGTWRKAATR
jgi:hypothetical protein